MASIKISKLQLSHMSPSEQMGFTQMKSSQNQKKYIGRDVLRSSSPTSCRSRAKCKVKGYPGPCPVKFENLWTQRSHNPSWPQFQCLSLMVKNFLLLSNPHFPCCRLWLVLLVLSRTSEESGSTLPVTPTQRVYEAAEWVTVEMSWFS